ncbi:isocitrate/isopropylmalate dehydrogenase family protein [Halopseudomonas pelagia]|uniref:Isocitrate dehydrogenase n=1 Tax=Halopseudomonas pelagia TaxID=553151 RepID=A0AA91Z7Q4_9GAMM|nr:isocitrate/isopropylmalate family dehydrogenase [Halopseudomonas pelagia]PCD01328.1 isocitrate dehydrogenase [Halopseudomonas pelagia]QFY55778.1 isocitrate/isopropylmalate dehydrogenase family protein [Halopseudomonas pelagia]
MRRLCVIPGDGIGQEVVPVAVRVLERLLPDLQVTEAEAGWDCFQRLGQSVPEATLQAMRDCGAGLFGAVSSPSTAVAGYRSAILTLRQQLALGVNLRPVRSWPGLSDKSGVDLLILRENSEGLYVGKEHMATADLAIAECHVSRQASEHIAQRASEIAKLRASRRITLVHKANVLPLTCGLFRDGCRKVLDAHGLSALVDERLVDVAALHLVERPEEFDLIVTTNLFGDVLSDLASHWGGGLGLAPSLNWGQGIALAEPVHGSAPDIAGSGRANPLAAVLSAGLLLRYHWQLIEQADCLDGAVEGLLRSMGKADWGKQTTRRVEQELLARL